MSRNAREQVKCLPSASSEWGKGCRRRLQRGSNENAECNTLVIGKHVHTNEYTLHNTTQISRMVEWPARNGQNRKTRSCCVSGCDAFGRIIRAQGVAEWCGTHALHNEQRFVSEAILTLYLNNLLTRGTAHKLPATN